VLDLLALARQRTIGQDDDFMQTDIAYTERLAHAIGLRDEVAIDEGDIQTIGMAQSHHGLMQIRQSTGDRAAGTAAPNNGDANLSRQ